MKSRVIPQKEHVVWGNCKYDAMTRTVAGSNAIGINKANPVHVERKSHVRRMDFFRSVQGIIKLAMVCAG
jgi:hypothetical protein